MNRRHFGRSVIATLAASQIFSRKTLGEPPSATNSSPLNLSVMLWTILPHDTFDRRIAAVAEAGYRSIELVHEFDHWAPSDFDQFNRRRAALGISVDAIALTQPGVANPSASDAFLRGVEGHIATAELLDCRDIIVLSGIRLQNLSAPKQRQASIDMLKRGGDLAARHGCRLLLESLDPEEEPAWFLNSVTECVDIVRAVGSPHVRVLYDFYHEQISAGNLIKKLTDAIDLIGLVHIADVPGRHEPGSGEINYGPILRRLVQLGFKGKIAMEFLPTDEPVRSLRSVREFAEAAVNMDVVAK